MCLTIDEKITNKVLDRLKKSKDGNITCYKIITRYGRAQFYDYQYKVGINKSNRKYKKLLISEQKFCCVHRGIHVYLNKPKLPDYNMNYYNVIAMKCNIKDFVAGGVYNNSHNAVFTKVTIEQKDYDKFLELI